VVFQVGTDLRWSEAQGGLALIALVLILLFLLAVPVAANAATVSVEPYVEPPSVDGFGSCSRYMMCPPDMIVFTAAPAESNQPVITVEFAYPRSRYVVRDQSTPVQAGPGCAQLDPQAAACTAGALGPVHLGDGDDWFASSLGGGDVFGGPGRDVLHRRGDGSMAGGAGDDVIVGDLGSGGGGDDLLVVLSGFGGSGRDTLECFPAQLVCHLDGGPGDDRLTGGTRLDRLLGGRGNDLLMSREDRSAGEAVKADRVDCGRGRRDRAVSDRRDDVKRCEQVALPG
jgi:hypothetical protein